MRGPAPAPTALKLLKGVRPARINKNEPKPTGVTGAIPKGWAQTMSAMAKKFWQKNAPDLARIGLLTHADLEAFRAMAEIYSRWLRCDAVLRRKGLTMKDYKGERLRPEAGLANKCETQFMAYCKQFGMVPAERGRTNVPGGEGGGEDGDLD
jgi:P27 family predicted phage terminase small subunit